MKLIDWTCQTCKTKNSGARHFEWVRCRGCKRLTLVTDRAEHIRLGRVLR